MLWGCSERSRSLELKIHTTRISETRPGAALSRLFYALFREGSPEEGVTVSYEPRVLGARVLGGEWGIRKHLTLRQPTKALMILMLMLGSPLFWVPCKRALHSRKAHSALSFVQLPPSMSVLLERVPQTAHSTSSPNNPLYWGHGIWGFET